MARRLQKGNDGSELQRTISVKNVLNENRQLTEPAVCISGR
jgi:hypothetical protein